MSTSISRSLPIDQLRKLQFLLGESSGLETLYPPEQPPVQFKAYVSGSWETCERFVKFDFVGEIPGIGVESFNALITYSESQHCYRMWAFAASQEEPLYLTGQFHGTSLVFISAPTPMVWGMQRLRYSFFPADDGSVELLGERWDLDGYAKYCAVVFRPN
jgi:hypothetical protein